MKIIVLRIMTVAILVFGLSGCLTNTSIAVQATSFNIAECKKEDVTISKETVDLNGEHNWTAECNGKKYECNYLAESDTNCYEITE